MRTAAIVANVAALILLAGLAWHRVDALGVDGLQGPLLMATVPAISLWAFLKR